MKIITFNHRELTVTSQGDDLLAGKKSYFVRIELEPEKKYHVMTDKESSWREVSGPEAAVPLFSMARQIELEGPFEDKNATLLLSYTPEHGFMAGAISEMLDS